jgi:DNA-binding response OmpR family regulator
MARLLLIEDDVELVDLLKISIGEKNTLVHAGTVRQAREYLTEQGFELVLLDLNLPDGEGFEVLSWMQSNDELALIPVILLTAREAQEDQFTGFSLGAEDYLIKPVDPIVLMARINAKLRNMSRRGGRALKVGGIKVKPYEQKCFFTDHTGVERVLDLTSIELKLLMYLSFDLGRTLTRNELIERVWGADVNVIGRTIDTHISHLRKKIVRYGCSIESVRGKGYRLSAFSEPGDMKSETSEEV